MADYSRNDRGSEEKERLWDRYKNWLGSLDRGQKIRYRILQAATIIAVIIILLFIVWSILDAVWIVEPDIPQPSISSGIGPDTQPEGPSSSGPEDGEDDPAFDGAEEPTLAQSGRKEHVHTFLLVGRDTVSGSTDTMILVTYDTANQTVNAMSLPRDTMVNAKWSTKKLNTVYNYNKGTDRTKWTENGMAGLSRYVGNLTGIVPDYYVVVEWKAVGELVDALGGVTFDVPYDMNYDDPAQDLHIHQAKGERLLTGDDAMQVIRWRRNNESAGGLSIGDTGRIKIQQDFLMAVARELLQPKNIAKIPDLANIFLENVSISSSLTLGNLIWFAQQAVGMDVEQDIHFFTMPYEIYNRYTSYTNFTSYVLPKAEEMLEIVNENLNPYNRDIRLSDLEVLIKNSDGSFTLTSGTLADELLARPGYTRSSYAPPATTTTPADPEEPEEEEPPEEEQADPMEPEDQDPAAPAEPDPAEQEPSVPENDPPQPPADPEPSGNAPSGTSAGEEENNSQQAAGQNVPQNQEEPSTQNGVLPAWPTPVH